MDKFISDAQTVPWYVFFGIVFIVGKYALHKFTILTILSALILFIRLYNHRHYLFSKTFSSSQVEILWPLSISLPFPFPLVPSNL